MAQFFYPVNDAGWFIVVACSEVCVCAVPAITSPALWKCGWVPREWTSYCLVERRIKDWHLAVPPPPLLLQLLSAKLLLMCFSSRAQQGWPHAAQSSPHPRLPALNTGLGFQSWNQGGTLSWLVPEVEQWECLFCTDAEMHRTNFLLLMGIRTCLDSHCEPRVIAWAGVGVCIGIWVNQVELLW